LTLLKVAYFRSHSPQHSGEMTVYRTLLVTNNAGKTKDELNTLAAKDGIGLNGCVRATPWECADQTLRDCNSKPELLKYWNKETRGVHESHVLEPKPVAAPPPNAATQHTRCDRIVSHARKSRQLREQLTVACSLCDRELRHSARFGLNCAGWQAGRWASTISMAGEAVRHAVGYNPQRNWFNRRCCVVVASGISAARMRNISVLLYHMSHYDISGHLMTFKAFLDTKCYATAFMTARCSDIHLWARDAISSIYGRKMLR
jgi:hypothetical protein